MTVIKPSEYLKADLTAFIEARDVAAKHVAETKKKLAAALLKEAGLKIGDTVISGDRWSYKGKPGRINEAYVRMDRHGDVHLRLTCQLIRADGSPGKRQFSIGKWSLPND